MVFQVFSPLILKGKSAIKPNVLQIKEVAKDNLREA